MKIFVEFENVCDITLMPTNIYNNCPYIMIDNFRLIDTRIIAIDTYRVFTNPIHAIWRFEKTVNRMSNLFSFYKFYEEGNVINEYKQDKKNSKDKLNKILINKSYTGKEQKYIIKK